MLGATGFSAIAEAAYLQVVNDALPAEKIRTERRNTMSQAFTTQDGVIDLLAKGDTPGIKLMNEQFNDPPGSITAPLDSLLEKNWTGESNLLTPEDKTALAGFLGENEFNYLDTKFDHDQIQYMWVMLRDQCKHGSNKKAEFNISTKYATDYLISTTPGGKVKVQIEFPVSVSAQPM